MPSCAKTMDDKSASEYMRRLKWLRNMTEFSADFFPPSFSVGYHRRCFATDWIIAGIWHSFSGLWGRGSERHSDEIENDSKYANEHTFEKFVYVCVSTNRFDTLKQTTYSTVAWIARISFFFPPLVLIFASLFAVCDFPNSNSCYTVRIEIVMNRQICYTNCVANAF